MTPFREIKAELLRDPKFRAEYERLRPEFERAAARIAARAPTKKPALGARVL